MSHLRPHIELLISWIFHQLEEETLLSCTPNFDFHPTLIQIFQKNSKMKLIVLPWTQVLSFSTSYFFLRRGSKMMEFLRSFEANTLFYHKIGFCSTLTFFDLFFFPVRNFWNPVSLVIWETFKTSITFTSFTQLLHALRFWAFMTRVLIFSRQFALVAAPTFFDTFFPTDSENHVVSNILNRFLPLYLKQVLEKILFLPGNEIKSQKIFLLLFGYAEKYLLGPFCGNFVEIELLVFGKSMSIWNLLSWHLSVQFTSIRVWHLRYSSFLFRFRRFSISFSLESLRTLKIEYFCFFLSIWGFICWK